VWQGFQSFNRKPAGAGAITWRTCGVALLILWFLPLIAHSIRAANRLGAICDASAIYEVCGYFVPRGVEFNMSELIEEYLAANIGPIHIAANCRDVLGFYNKHLELDHTQVSNPTFPGVATIANQMMSIIDLRNHSVLTSEEISGPQHVICFQTNVNSKYAVIVDDFVGLVTFEAGRMFRSDKSFANQFQNLDLLFPMIAIDHKSTIYHILDTSFLDKLDPISRASRSSIQINRKFVT